MASLLSRGDRAVSGPCARTSSHETAAKVWRTCSAPITLNGPFSNCVSVKAIEGPARVRSGRFALVWPRTGVLVLRRITSPVKLRAPNNGMQASLTLARRMSAFSPSKPQPISNRTHFPTRKQAASLGSIFRNRNPPRARAKTARVHVFYQQDPRDSAEMRQVIRAPGSQAPCT